MNKEPATTNDVMDGRSDEEKLKSETTILDLPDVEDIPGQEHIHVPKMKEYG